MTSHSQSHFLVDRNLEHLRLLGIYHWVIAGAAALLAVLVYGLPLVMGAALYPVFSFLPTYAPGVSPLQLWAGLLVMVVQIVVLGLNGWCLRSRKNWISSIILSCIECLCLPPLGLILGISAVLVLRRESVQTIFALPKENGADSKH
ncbi:hypothetical protein [Vampirovibrio sp.]|uniref:hypothetical protein n=1 Tax=Vampirovibrio sp. TaxID=2717857 RepID=UPI0035943BAB